MTFPLKWELILKKGNDNQKPRIQIAVYFRLNFKEPSFRNDNDNQTPAIEFVGVFVFWHCTNILTYFFKISLTARVSPIEIMLLFNTSSITLDNNVTKLYFSNSRNTDKPILLDAEGILIDVV